jgi:hypothetical protein
MVLGDATGYSRGIETARIGPDSELKTSLDVTMLQPMPPDPSIQPGSEADTEAVRRTDQDFLEAAILWAFYRQRDPTASAGYLAVARAHLTPEFAAQQQDPKQLGLLLPEAPDQEVSYGYPVHSTRINGDRALDSAVLGLTQPEESSVMQRLRFRLERLGGGAWRIAGIEVPELETSPSADEPTPTTSTPTAP